MRPLLFLLPLLLLLVAQAAPSFTATDAQVAGALTAASLVPGEGYTWNLEAEELTVWEYRSPLVVGTGVSTHWFPGKAEEHRHQDTTGVAVSSDGALLVILGGTFDARGNLQVASSTTARVEDRHSGGGDPPGADTSRSLVAFGADSVTVRGDFLVGLDRWLLAVDGEVYDSRHGQGVHAEPARHHVVHARNATLTLGAGVSAWFEDALVTSPEGVFRLQSSPGGMEVHPVRSTASVAPPTGQELPAWASAATAAVLTALVAVLGVWCRSVEGWTERADVALRSRSLHRARILAWVATLRGRSSPDAWSVAGQVHDVTGRFWRAYQCHARAAHLYLHPEDRAHAAFDAAVAAANMGQGHRAADMLKRAVDAWPDVAARHIDREPAFNRIITDPAFQAALGNGFVA